MDKILTRKGNYQEIYGDTADGTNCSCRGSDDILPQDTSGSPEGIEGIDWQGISLHWMQQEVLFLL